MNLQESIRRILREDKKTKSTNKEFSKYKNSKFNTLRDYTLQDIVDNWDSLSDHKNENIKTIKHFINNPDKITDLVYDEKGLEDGYHRLIAAKILKKPRFTYRLVENLQENIRRIIRETLESKWNEGKYDYQYGYCHYFAYDIIGKIRERFPNRKVNYYLLLANEVNKDTDEVEQDYLLHVYIKIDDMLLDSNGFTTFDKAEKRMDEWYERQLPMVPEEYELNMWTEESDEIPEMFFNNRFCNTGKVKRDIERFLSNPIVKRILRDK